MARRIGRTDNGGPPIEDYKGPPWGKSDPYLFLAWRKAHAGAWKSIPREIALRRAEKAGRLGLTDKEYTLEILERGRFLQPEDVERIDAIKAARKRRRQKPHTNQG